MPGPEPRPWANRNPKEEKPLPKKLPETKAPGWRPSPPFSRCGPQQAGGQLLPGPAHVLGDFSRFGL